MAPCLQGVRHSSQTDGEEVAQSRASNLHRGPSAEPLQPLRKHCHLHIPPPPFRGRVTLPCRPVGGFCLVTVTSGVSCFMRFTQRQTVCSAGQQFLTCSLVILKTILQPALGPDMQ